VVIVLEDEPGRRRLVIAALCALMALAYVIVCALPFGRDFFDLSTPTGSMALAWSVGAVVVVALLTVALKVIAARAPAEG
jgi:hypothetical protein